MAKRTAVAFHPVAKCLLKCCCWVDVVVVAGGVVVCELSAVVPDGLWDVCVCSWWCHWLWDVCAGLGSGLVPLGWWVVGLLWVFAWWAVGLMGLVDS